MASYNLADLFESVVDAVPDRTALVAGEVRLTFAQLEARANRLAHHFLDAGLGAGDHIGIYAWNRAEWIEAMWACFKIRAVPININYRYVAEELCYIADNADLNAIVFEQSLASVLSAVVDDLPQLRHCIRIADDQPADDSIAGFPGDRVLVDYEAALAAASERRDFAPRSGDDLYILYTGGTTGMPKGTMWRHEDIFFAALQGGNPAGAPISAPQQLPGLVSANNPIATLCPAPMMHGGGQWYCMIYQLAGHNFVLYTERQFDAASILGLIEREQVVSLIVVGDAMARPLAETIAEGRHDLSALFVIGSGGASLSASIKEELRQLLPHAMIMDSFGASETGSGGMVVAQQPSAASGDSTIEDNGGPRFTLAANTAILDDALQPITAAGGVGRLARCGHIPLGYYKDEQKTAATFKTDAAGVRWVIPGDYARVHADGTAELLGRGSGCINSGGEKIFPEEVESALKAHPAVFDAGVVGMPHERFGQQVVAMVQLRNGAAFERDAIVAFCRQKIAGYKCPRQLFTVDRVPRTPVGKPDYRRIRTLAEELVRSSHDTHTSSSTT